jgi:predicted membrane-bound spermidine synthase
VDAVEVCVRPGTVVVRGTVLAGALVAGLVAVDVLAPVGMLLGVVVVGVLEVVVRTAAAVVTVLVMAGVVEPEPPTRLTSAAASTPSDSATTTASVATRPFQLGDAARRVRAAAPQ